MIMLVYLPLYFHAFLLMHTPFGKVFNFFIVKAPYLFYNGIMKRHKAVAAIDIDNTFVFIKKFKDSLAWIIILDQGQSIAQLVM